MSGTKTYICVGVGLLVILAKQLNFIDDETAKLLLEICGFGSIAALRSALSKSKTF